MPFTNNVSGFYIPRLFFPTLTYERKAKYKKRQNLQEITQFCHIYLKTGVNIFIHKSTGVRNQFPNIGHFGKSVLRAK